MGKDCLAVDSEGKHADIQQYSYDLTLLFIVTATYVRQHNELEPKTRYKYVSQLATTAYQLMEIKVKRLQLLVWTFFCVRYRRNLPPQRRHSRKRRIEN